MYSLDKKVLQDRAKWCDITAKYIALPCLTLSIIAMLNSTLNNNTSMMYFNAFMIGYNALAYVLNGLVRDSLLKRVSELDEADRQQRIRDLNPNKR
jgi:hypothetical protein